jgi:hypothetical protein
VKPKGEIGFCLSIHVVEKIGPVVHRERTALLEILEFGAFEKRVWPGEGTREESEARSYNESEQQNARKEHWKGH